ncbi:hypothetical protein [Nonomuraea typhae]|uniref:hypothetical protein n=1 Tax=Nonomuraea typhae TaxID=2603600 RepID=UPI0012FC4109|nr:hypothetical protein [Nonomuraea typhae]
MERGLRIIAAALLMAGLVACGGNSAGPDIDEQAQVRLREILNKDPRLPEGFTARAQQPWKTPFAAGDRDCRAVLAPAEGRAPQRALTAQAAASYPGNALGETAGVGLARYSGEEAAWHIDDLGKALRSCHAVDTGAGTELRVRTRPVGGVGDEAVAATLTGRLNGYPYALNVLLVREGDTLLSLVHTGMNQVDPRRTEQLAQSVLGMTRA